MEPRSRRRQLVAGTLEEKKAAGSNPQHSGGNVLEGIWLAFVGRLLGGSARAGRGRRASRQRPDDVPVDSAMEPDPPIVDASTPVEDVVNSWFRRQAKRAALVTDYGCLVGMVSLADLRRIGEKHWPELTVGDVMIPAPLPCVEANESLARALSLMKENGVDQLVVIVGSRPVGTLTREETLDYLRTRDELGLRQGGDDGVGIRKRAA